MENNFKLLVIANNCLSHHNSNGRTLLNLLHRFKKEEVIQIYTSGEYPTEEVADQFLRVSNKEVVCSYYKFKGCFSFPKVCSSPTSVPSSHGGQKTAATMLLRDLVWDHAVFEHRAIIKWAREQQSSAILLQLSDSTLLITLATKIAKKLGIPLYTYNTEDYYFKDYDYMKKTLKAGSLYRMFHRRFQRKFSRMMQQVSCPIYNCEGLKELYQSKFDTSAEVIMPVSDFVATEHNKKKGIVYAGNLGVGRHLSLMEVADKLRVLFPDEIIDVYGTAEDMIMKQLACCQNIVLHGFVPYQDVCKAMNESKLLLHMESFDSYYAVDTKYAFSTKLADCCKSEVPILLYAPKDCEATCYFKRYDAAFVATDTKELETALKLALTDCEKQQEKIKNARRLIDTNHDYMLNGQRTRKILEGM